MQMFSIVLLLAGLDLCGQPESRNARDFLLAELRTDGGACVIAFSSKGEVVSFGYNRLTDNYTFVSWDISAKKLVQAFKSEFKTQAGFLDYSPNGELILAGDLDGNVDVISKTGKRVASFALFEFGGELGVNEILDVKFLSNDEILTVARENIASRRNIVNNVSKLYYLRGREPNGAAISKGSNTFAWVNDTGVYIWKPMLDRKSTPVHILAPENRYRRVAFSDDGSSVFCATPDSEVGLYDVKKGKLIKAWNAHERASFAGGIALKQNKGFVTACEDGQVRIWRPDGGLAVTLSLARDEKIFCIACNHDSTVLAIGTTKNILICDLKKIVDGSNGK